MAVTVMHDIATSDLETDDIVIRNDEDMIFVMAEEIDGSHYLRITWTERVGSSITWTTTAEPWNTWPLVIRDGAL